MTRARIPKIEDVIGAALTEARAILVGKEASLLASAEPKRLGYRGRITDVIASSRGQLLACFYVYRRGTTDIINGEAWTRQYRPISHLDFAQ